MKLENGRPENTEGRLEKEIRVYEFLDELGVEYQRVDHEAAMTMEACEEIDRTLGDGTAICKNLFLCNRQETDFYLLLMPGVLLEYLPWLLPYYRRAPAAGRESSVGTDRPAESSNLNHLLGSPIGKRLHRVPTAAPCIPSGAAILRSCWAHILT